MSELEQLTLDAAESDRRKEEGMARAIGNADGPWKEQFRAGVIRLAQIGIPFTSEDVLAVVGMPPGNPNVVGATINALARQGYIERVGIRAAERAKAHGRFVSVWGPGKKIPYSRESS